MKIIIYAICHPDTMDIRYIGKTNNLKRRILDYKYKSKTGKTAKDKFIQFLKAQGKDVVFEILEECDESNWRERERYYIRKYKLEFTLLNNYNGIYANSDIEKEKIKLLEHKEDLINATFLRIVPSIRIMYERFDLITLVGNKYYLVYDSRNLNDNSNYYYYIYMHSNQFYGRNKIPKTNKIYKSDILNLPIIKGIYNCWYRTGVEKIDL